MNPGDAARMLVSVIVFLTVGATIILRGPLGKALARRIEGKAAVNPALAERLLASVPERVKEGRR